MTSCGTKEVVCVLKALSEDGELSLSDGRTIVRPDSPAKHGNVVRMSPDFRLVVLANRPGYPFMGVFSLIQFARLVSVYFLFLSFFPRASELRVLLIMGVCQPFSHLHVFTSHLLIFTSAHLHICSSSHLLIFSPSHLHIFSSSHLLIFTASHLHIFTSSHPHIFTSSYLHIFSSSHLLIFTSSHPHILTSSHLLIFTSSHLHIFSSSHLHIFTSSHTLLPSCSLAFLLSCPLALSFFSISLLKARGSAN